ncbi:Transposase [Shigella dysenteriae 1617]|uniref:Transposase n=1 Tax=Shigella dysenteriae 1617 TaxID=754093 RepID=A0A0A6ZQF3_SHIDY|nr:Transposase [Shigella dysenteriae 1617]
MAVTAAKSVMAFRVLTMAVDLCRLTTRTMNVNAGHERTSKARIIHQIQLIRGITRIFLELAAKRRGAENRRYPDPYRTHSFLLGGWLDGARQFDRKPAGFGYSWPPATQRPHAYPAYAVS